MKRWIGASPILGVWLCACINIPVAPTSIADACLKSQYTDALQVPSCLLGNRTITAEVAAAADSVLWLAAALRDSLRADTAVANFNKAAELTRSLQHLSDFYGSGLLADSARFDRMVDHVSVTIEYVRGNSIQWRSGRAWPVRTPWLSWTFYPNLGMYFQPVNTMQFLEYLLPRSSTPTDSILQMAENLYRYAIWRDVDGRRFPVWEYDFPWNSGGVTVNAPWVSGMAQGLALSLFAEAYKRTGSQLWHDRAYQVLNSFYIPWDRGGVLLPDTTHGYWWEEYHPTVQVWNGSAWALLTLGYFADVTQDPEARRLFNRGVDALKYYTPLYDTGYWTLYSRTQGYNTVAYNNLCVKIMDTFYLQTGDPWFKTIADRWRAYVPPPGVS